MMVSVVDSLNVERLVSWTSTNYQKVSRSDHTYDVSEEFISNELSKLLSAYHDRIDPQEQRLTRDLIDFCLRRYHQYAIKQRVGAHYTQAGYEGATVFEHLIPASTIRDLLLTDALSIRHALNAPTVNLARNNDKKLRDAGLTSTTEDLWHPFRRYLKAGITDQFTTFDGELINDLAQWTLQDHFLKVFGDP